MRFLLIFLVQGSGESGVHLHSPSLGVSDMPQFQFQARLTSLTKPALSFASFLALLLLEE